MTQSTDVNPPAGLGERRGLTSRQPHSAIAVNHDNISPQTIRYSPGPIVLGELQPVEAQSNAYPKPGSLRQVCVLALVVSFALVLSIATAASAEWRTSFGPTSSWRVELLGVSPEGTPLVGSNAGCAPEEASAMNAPQIAPLSALDGDVLWTLTQEDSHPYSLADCGWWRPLVDSEGNIYMAGYPKGEYPGSGADSSGWFLVSYSQNGTFRWASPIDGLELDAYEGVTAEAIGADGNIYVYVDGHLHGYRASDGTSLWDVAVPAQNQGFGLYADASGLTVGGTIRFSYSGQLIHPAPADGVVREASIAQEPGGAVYTVTADHSKCAARKPYIGIRVTRWTLSGIDWVKTLKPPNPAASEEECNVYSHEFAVRAVPGGGVVVAASNRYQTPVEEMLLFDLDTKGHVRWTHETARGWSDYQSFSSIRVTTDGEIVTLEHGREPCELNIYGECGVVAVSFINATTGHSARTSVLLRNVVQPYESAAYEPQPQSESLGVAPGAVYLSLEIDGKRQIVQLSAPGLGTDYAEALRADYQPVDGAEYVALGDSYSSGEGNPPYEAGTDNEEMPDVCHRSPKAYGPRLDQMQHLGSMLFEACSGAVTNDIFAANISNPTEPAQLTWLTNTTKVVTLTIGGNDAGFPFVLEHCVVWAPPIPNNFGCSLDTELESETQARLSALAGGPYATTPPPQSEPIHSVLSVIQAIYARAQSAHVVVGLYPLLFGASKKHYGSAPPVGSAACEVGSFLGEPLWIGYEDAIWLNERGEQLNQIIMDAVAEAAHQGIQVSEAVPKFTHHGFCDKSELWFHRLGLEVKTLPELEAELAPMPGSFHPTEIGQQAGYETAFAKALR